MNEILSLDQVMSKSKYTRRTGGPGHYKYFYGPEKGSGVRAGFVPKPKEKKASERMAELSTPEALKKEADSIMRGYSKLSNNLFSGGSVGDAVKALTRLETKVATSMISSKDKNTVIDAIHGAKRHAKSGNPTELGPGSMTYYSNHIYLTLNKYRNIAKSLSEDNMASVALVVLPGEIEPLEKAQKVKHPAGLSTVGAKATTNNPTPASHQERMKFAKMAMERMIGSSRPEDEGKYAPVSRTALNGREAGQKAPYSNYADSASGMGSQASDNFGRRTVVVNPSEIGASGNNNAPSVGKVRKPRS